MSGHSKWSKVKHQKATTDVTRAAAFTKASRAITVAVHEGGGITDPAMNFRLRLAIEKARAVNMPKDTIERAIAKAKGEGGAPLAQILYEGYAPGGVAVLVAAATDNRQRTGSLVKHLFDRFGGNLASPGSVSFLFDRALVLTVAKNDYTLDDLLAIALESGADDVVEEGDSFEIYITNDAAGRIKENLENRGLTILNTEFIMRPKTTILVTDPDVRQKLEDLISQLEDLEDVENVYTNVKRVV